METYSNQIEAINQQTAKFPKVNSRMSRHFGEKRHKAGMDFLHRLHDEIQTANPDWRKDDEAPQPRKVIHLKDIKVAAPELTDDYLAQIGIPTTLASMSGKAQHGMEVLDGGKATDSDTEPLEEAA